MPRTIQDGVNSYRWLFCVSSMVPDNDSSHNFCTDEAGLFPLKFRNDTTPGVFSMDGRWRLPLDTCFGGLLASKTFIALQFTQVRSLLRHCWQHETSLSQHISRQQLTKHRNDAATKITFFTMGVPFPQWKTITAIIMGKWFKIRPNVTSWFQFTKPFLRVVSLIEIALQIICKLCLWQDNYYTVSQQWFNLSNWLLNFYSSTSFNTFCDLQWWDFPVPIKFSDFLLSWVKSYDSEPLHLRKEHIFPDFSLTTFKFIIFQATLCTDAAKWWQS